MSAVMQQRYQPVPPIPPGATKAIVSPFRDTDRWRLRLPAESPRGLWGPFVGHGGCLGEFMPEGRTMRWFDGSIAADDGDIVLIELDPDFLRELVQSNRDKPEWLAKYGTNPPRLATKWLRHYKNELYMFEEKHGCPLGNNRILGVCSYALIDGLPVYGSGPDHDGFAELAPSICAEINIGEASGAVDTTRIQNEAVTTIASVEDDSVSLTLPGAILSETMPTQGLAHTLVLTCSFNVWISASPGSGENEFFLTVNGNATQLVSGQRAKVSATSAPGERVMLQVETPIVPADEDGLGVVAIFRWVRDNGSTNAEIRGLALRAEAIKR